jgi:hypothetical protein
MINIKIGILRFVLDNCTFDIQSKTMIGIAKYINSLAIVLSSTFARLASTNHTTIKANNGMFFCSKLAKISILEC